MATERTIAGDLTPLSPSPRTRLIRGKHRAQQDREALRDTLDSSLICHLGLVIDGVPRVLPTSYGFDWPDRPGPDHEPPGGDPYGTLYLHGSAAAASLRAATGQTVCVSVTTVDGIVLARAGFHHSANYRSAVIIGRPRLLTDEAERLHALDRIIDHLVPGRSATLRPPTRKELAATTVLALSLREASVKSRAGDPVDEPEDVAAGGWAGVLPVHTTAGPPVTAADCPPDAAVPDHLLGIGRAQGQVSIRSASTS